MWAINIFATIVAVKKGSKNNSYFLLNNTLE